MYSGSINKYDLPPFTGKYSLKSSSCSLRLIGCDRYLHAYEMIHKRGLADISSADYSDKAGTECLTVQSRLSTFPKISRLLSIFDSAPTTTRALSEITASIYSASCLIFSLSQANTSSLSLCTSSNVSPYI